MLLRRAAQVADGFREHVLSVDAPALVVLPCPDRRRRDDFGRCTLGRDALHDVLESGINLRLKHGVVGREVVAPGPLE